jgi:rhodanese-related sulfurtransferase
MKKTVFLSTLLVFIVIAVWVTSTVNAENVPRITKEQLKGMYDNSDLLILDVRSGRDWKASEFKIQAAERAAPSEFKSWAKKYPKDISIVLYCA